MAEQNLKLHFIAGVTISTLLWVVPIPLRAPKAVTTFALMGSVAGYAYCFAISKSVSKEWKQERRMELKEEKIANHTMALTEMSEKRELEQLFAPLTNAVSGVVSHISETVSEMPSPPVAERGFGVSEMTETTEWTAYGLAMAEAQKIVQQALADGMNQTQILETFWEVKPGSSKAYKQALEQFRLLTSQPA